MARVLLTGTYCSQNKGDAAMQITAAQGLKRLRPGTEVAIASPFPELDRPVYGQFGIQVVPSYRRKLGRCLIQMGLGWMRPGWVRGVRTPDLAAIEACDLVVDLSGDGLTEDYGPHVVLSHLYPIWLALELGKKVMVCAQTIGPFRTLKPVVRRILDRVDCITPRDPFTEAQLHQLGIRNPRIQPVSDLAHLLEPASVPTAWKEGGGPVLGMTVSRLLGHRKSLGWRRQGQDKLEALASVLEKWIQNPGFRVLLLAHSTGPKPTRDDRHITARLAERLARPDVVRFITEDLGANEVKGWIGQCDLFCAMRLHSAIAALSQGVPCVVIGYGPKALGLMESWGQEKWVLPVERLEAGSLGMALQAAWQDRAGIRVELDRLRVPILERANANLQIASSLLD